MEPPPSSAPPPPLPTPPPPPAPPPLPTPAPRRRTGRPLSFQREAALHQAMKLFWRHGYEATSLTELTTAMGITPPSLYTAFGDKKRLFREAVAAYISGPVTSDSIIDQAPTAKAAAYGLLEASAIGFTGTDTPPGCLLAAGAIACSPEAEDIRAELSAIRRQVEHRLTAKIAACPGMSVADPEALAAHVMAVIQGMSTLARDGATREKLLRIARIAMAAWPA